MQHLKSFESWNLNESLNKDILSFGRDLEKLLKSVGIKTLVLVGKESTSEQRAQVKKEMGLAILELGQSHVYQILILHYNPKDEKQVSRAVNHFQLVPYSGQVHGKEWSRKQVHGAINPGDIYMDRLNDGTIQFMRLASTKPTVKKVQ